MPYATAVEATLPPVNCTHNLLHCVFAAVRCRCRDKPRLISDGEKMALLYNIACCHSQMEDARSGLVALAGEAHSWAALLTGIARCSVGRTCLVIAAFGLHPENADGKRSWSGRAWSFPGNCCKRCYMHKPTCAGRNVLAAAGCMEAGYTDFGQVRTDPDLTFLRADSRFEVRARRNTADVSRLGQAVLAGQMLKNGTSIFLPGHRW